MLQRHNLVGLGRLFAWAAGAIVSFHIAYLAPGFQWLLFFSFYCLLQLCTAPTAKIGFYLGLTVGLGIYAPQLSFFWNIFQVAAIPLWLILGCWVAAFVALGTVALKRLGLAPWALLAPWIWMGLEYFRSEVYYLKFSWVNAGYAFSTSPTLPYLSRYGVYGIGFFVMAVAALTFAMPRLSGPRKKFGFIALGILIAMPGAVPKKPASSAHIRVTGIQMEFPDSMSVIHNLDLAHKNYPETDLFVLSEYTATGPVPNSLLAWCKKNHAWLAVGAEDPVGAIQYYNTVFVVDTNGSIVFSQAKSIPIQFFKDGLPATHQAVWPSPWGAIGFAICYDASYTTVIDGLIRQGAQCLIFPTMDVQDWGAYQHTMHARVSPMRAAEYALPVFRLCSSGISEAIDASGHILATAPFPGPSEMIHATLDLQSAGRLPLDRFFTMLSVLSVVLLALWLAFAAIRAKKQASQHSTV